MPRQAAGSSQLEVLCRQKDRGMVNKPDEEFRHFDNMQLEDKECRQEKRARVWEKEEDRGPAKK